ncbi:DUF4283 domain-containing protein [Cephalotus follicularis]|uniref:DUF4283 domain-containing protein n=1 Tax=Cephalotus follicularis TaxID=3775 RepID=A0A1Q3CKL5_CEPFO|nr:DUF4283 domain-containing protein [Cephalotus follicularis]
MELGNGYYLAKFDYMHDCTTVLTCGPWMIFGHCLLFQRWKPYFKPSLSTLKSTAMWIRLPELPLEFYDEDFLMSSGKLIGNPLRLDKNTTLAIRTRYARLCVDVDISKPLISKIEIEDLCNWLNTRGFTKYGSSVVELDIRLGTGLLKVLWMQRKIVQLLWNSLTIGAPKVETWNRNMVHG